jgi:hypothetical protein
MDMNEQLKALIKKWDEEAAAWRAAGDIARKSEPDVSYRNYARAGILESCSENLQEIINRYEEP